MTQYGTNPGVLLTYDGDGNRVSETIGGTTTKYLVDSLNPTHLPQVLDELVNGSVTRTYAYGLQRISENQQINGTWTPSFYGYDGHRNVRFLTNSIGTATDSYDFDSFGMPTRTSGTTPNTFLYSGERSDSSIGQYDLRARYYNQATGRFLSADPEDGEAEEPITLHKYLYAGDDPVDRSDPSGRSAYAETINLNLRIALSPYVIRGLQVAAVAINCALVWEGSKSYAETVAGPFGTVTMVAPCIWMGRRGKSDPIPYPGTPCPGPAPGEPPRCNPCPPPSPFWEGNPLEHGGTAGVHFHWYTWNQKPYPDCTCYPVRMVDGTPPPGGTPYTPGGSPWP